MPKIITVTRVQKIAAQIQLNLHAEHDRTVRKSLWQFWKPKPYLRDFEPGEKEALIKIANAKPRRKDMTDTG